MDLLGTGEDTAAEVARRFVSEYEQAHRGIDAEDMWTIEELVRSWADAFWYLPEMHRTEVLSLMLERSDRRENTAFLDQFGGMELAEMNRSFGAEGHPLLAEYLQVAEQEGGRHRDDLQQLISPAGAESLPDLMIEQVATVLRTGGGGTAGPSQAAVRRLASRASDPSATRRSTGNVMRGLFHLAVDAESRTATTHLWSGRVSAALGAGDLATADTWLEVLDSPEFADGLRQECLDDLAESVTGSSLDTLAGLVVNPRRSGPGSVTSRAAPALAASGLMRELDGEPAAGRRAALLGAVRIVAEADPTALVSLLDLARPGVIRAVLGSFVRPGETRVCSRLQPFTRHSDAGVRAEALTALERLGDPGLGKLLLERLRDRDPRVRDTAGRLLTRIEDPTIERYLIRRIDVAGSDEATAAVAVLARRDTPEARKVVAHLARRRFSWSPRDRRIKAAARAALEGNDE
jgi:hypothetical protein